MVSIRDSIEKQKGVRTDRYDLGLGVAQEFPHVGVSRKDLLEELFPRFLVIYRVKNTMNGQRLYLAPTGRESFASVVHQEAHLLIV